jgi:site-specific recombinase XerD
VERGLAKLTIAAYTSDIVQFADFLRSGAWRKARAVRTFAISFRNYFPTS